MKNADFEIFSKLIRDVWFKSFPEMEFNESIDSYESKLLQIADKIEELTIDKIQKEGYPITTRSLRIYTNAVLKNKNSEINPSSRVREILSRYVLGISKLTGKELFQWDEKKEYRIEKYWKQYQHKNFNASPVSITNPIEKDLPQKDEKIEDNLEKSQQENSFVFVKNKFRRRVVIALSLVLFTLILIGYFAFQNAPKEDIDIDFRTSFKNINTLGELYKTGWSILDVDTDYIQQGLKNANGKGLQLFTLQGDYWVTDTMRRFIKNTFALAIPQGDFKAEITLTISDFSDFKCPHQQAGIILLNDTLNLANNIRYIIVQDSGKERIRLQQVYSKAKLEKNKWDQNLNDILLQRGFPDQNDSISGIKVKRYENVALQIINYHGHFIFRYKAGGNDRPFYLAFVNQFNFVPKFICLVAFQGQVNYREKLIVCDNMPVTFSDFHISPNNNDDKNLFDELLKKYQ